MKVKRYGLVAIGLMLVGLLAGCVDNSTDNFIQIDQSQYKTTFNDVRTSYVYKTEANQKGDVKILVVPVEFNGYLAENLPAGREGTRNHINEVVFGESPDENPDTLVQWESLRSFYDKSSYGQCKMSGYVTDWWKVNKTPRDFANGASVQGLISDISSYYSLGIDENVDPKDFDANDDGFIDLTILVYSAPAKVLGSNDDIFWAYCTQTSARPDRVNPKVSRYIWMSNKFMYDAGYWVGNTFNNWSNAQIADDVNFKQKLDAHTFIHESGHGLGLADYYSYDDGDISPTGQLDMMDHNIGDHNAYSKAVYGWINPYVVTGRATITINSFQKTGDSIIVPIRSLDWVNNSYTLMDEYLIIEYDTIDNLVVFDSEHPYENLYPQWFTTNGVRVFHADSRIGVFTKSGNNFVGYGKRTDIANEDNYVYLAHDNTPSRTVNNNRLLELLSVKGAGVRGASKNSDLFLEGDSFGFSTYTNFLMNTRSGDNSEKTPLGYKFEITSMTEDSCTIDFYVA